MAPPDGHSDTSLVHASMFKGMPATDPLLLFGAREMPGSQLAFRALPLSPQMRKKHREQIRAAKMEQLQQRRTELLERHHHKTVDPEELRRQCLWATIVVLARRGYQHRRVHGVISARKQREERQQKAAEQVRRCLLQGICRRRAAPCERVGGVREAGDGPDSCRTVLRHRTPPPDAPEHSNQCVPRTHVLSL